MESAVRTLAQETSVIEARYPLTKDAYRCKMHIDVKNVAAKRMEMRQAEPHNSPFAGDYEKGKAHIMADTQVNQATRELIASLRQTTRAIADSAVDAQQRNVAFAQSVLENGVEVLRSQAESTRTLLQELMAQARSGQPGWQEGFQAAVESTVAAQERNAKFAQSVFENGIEVLQSQVGVTRALMQELEQQAQKQQDAFQSLAHESLDAYLGFLRAPFSYYRQAFDAAEAATREGLENFQQATRQGLEHMQKATRQAQSAAHKPGK